MALVINEKATVATGMSPIVEAGLYADEVFIDGVTFSSRFTIGAAGQIQVMQYKGGDGVEPGVPGSNFVDTEFENTVININLNNSFKYSAKVPLYFSESLPSNVLMNKTLEVTEKTRVGRQQTALASLVSGGTASSDTVKLTSSNLKSKISSARTELRKKHAKPNVVLASVDTYSLMLSLAGGEYTPMYNDEVLRSGRVGMWLGMIWVESDLLDSSTNTYKYIDDAGTSKTVDTSKVEFIMYDANAFSIIDRLDTLRVKDSEQFVGSKIQEEIVSGFKVTNKDCVLIKKYTATQSSAGTV